MFKINEDIAVARLFNGRVQPVLDANEHEAVFFALGLLAARRIRDQTLERGLERVRLVVVEDSLTPDDVDDSRQVAAVISGSTFLLDPGLGLQGALLIFAAGRRHDPLQRRVDGLAHLRSEVQELGDRRVSCERRVPRRRRICRGEALAELQQTVDRRVARRGRAASPRLFICRPIACLFGFYGRLDFRQALLGGRAACVVRLEEHLHSSNDVAHRRPWRRQARKALAR